MKNTQVHRNEPKLVIITRSDLNNGFQAQQSTHSTADFAYEFPTDFKNWKETSNSIICLGVNNEEELDKWYNILSDMTNVTKFYEPDIKDQLTSICLYANEPIRKKLSSLPLLGRTPKHTYESVIKNMLDTPQTSTQNVLEHGISVNKFYLDLIGERNFDWKLPDWFIENEEFIFNNLYDYNIIKEYQIMHDCGKPYCMVIDEDGKRHFPDHAKVSHKIFSEISNDKTVADLILKDMVFHTIKADEVENFIQENPIQTVLTLMVTSLCELHSNASMFGGIESTSFKIKYKQLDKRGKQILNLIKAEEVKKTQNELAFV